MSKRIAIFPGSFDPFTKGHEDIVTRGVELFDEIIIAIGINPKKKRLFDLKEMLKKIETHFYANSKISVQTYDTLTGTFASSVGAKFILRGLRNSTDYEYEASIAQANKKSKLNIETVFVISSPELSYISSSIAREIYNHNGELSEYVPFDV